MFLINHYYYYATLIIVGGAGLGVYSSRAMLFQTLLCLYWCQTSCQIYIFGLQRKGGRVRERKEREERGETEGEGREIKRKRRGERERERGGNSLVSFMHHQAWPIINITIATHVYQVFSRGSYLVCDRCNAVTTPVPFCTGGATA